MSEVTVVRIYLHERDPGLKAALRYLHDESEVGGLTMFRGVMGYGASHEERSSSLLDLSFDLPVVVEFFDAPGRARAIVEHLVTLVDPAHVVSWRAQAGTPS